MNTEAIQNLLAVGKTEEAGNLLTDFFKQDLSGEDNGEVLAGFAKACVDVRNELLENQIDNLKAIAEALELVDKTKKTNADQQRLDEIRKQLNIKK